MDRFDALFASRYFAAYERLHRPAASPARAGRWPFRGRGRGGSSSFRTSCWGSTPTSTSTSAWSPARPSRGPRSRTSMTTSTGSTRSSSGLLPEVEAVVGDFSPLLGLLGEDWRAGRHQGARLQHGRGARRRLAARHTPLAPAAVRLGDWPFRRSTARSPSWARSWPSPAGWSRQAVEMIRDTESKDVPAIIDALNSIVPEG